MTAIILLVEDNPDDEKLALRAFSAIKVGNEIVVAHDGVEALDFLFATGPHAGRDQDDPPAVVLLDLRQPVVILTSSDEEQDRITSYRLGANSYVRKPVDFDQFIESARQLGLYWLLINQPPPKVPHTT